MVVSQQFVEEVDGLVAHEALVLGRDKAMPRLLGEAAEDVVILGIELYLVLVEVVEEIVGAEDLCNFDQLIRIAITMEEWLLAKDHGCEHGPETPHVERVIILLEIDQQLGALEIARRDPDVVLSARVVELGEAPIDEAKLRKAHE
jgi:hypothetical protein